MKYGFKNNIRIYLGNEKENGGFIDSVLDGTKKQIESMDISRKALQAIVSAKFSTNPKVQLVYDILRTTNAITYDPLELASRFQERDGGKGAKAILEALKSAEKGEIHIVVYDELGSYKSINFREYEKYIQSKPGKIDATLIDGLVDLYKINKENSFTEETWSNIASYLVSIEWKLKKPINNNSKNFLNELYNKVNTIYTTKLNIAIEPVIKKLGGKSPELSRLLKSNNLLGDDGKTDFTKMIGTLKIKNLNEFEPALNKKIEEIKKQSEKLLQLGNAQLKDLNVKDLTASGLGIDNNIIINGKPQNLDKKNIQNWNLNEINAAIPSIEKRIKHLDKDLSKESNPKKVDSLLAEKTRLNGIFEALTQKKIGFEKAKQVGELNQAKNDGTKIIRSNKIGKVEDVLAILGGKEARKRQEVAGNTSLARTELIDINNNSEIVPFEKAQKLYLELSKKGNLTQSEEAKKREYFAIIEAHKNIARTQKNAEKSLGKEEAREIFIQTNRFISGNQQETYDFKALEKIATLTDPESTPGEKSLARLEAGQSIPMWKALEGEMQTSVLNAPELGQVNISKNQDGTYNIPLFDAKGISKEQVEEYKESTKLYAELGLSQFIPHIPLINTELRKKGINATIDGQVSTTEQQQILKALYSKLFGKEIISSNLTEVERAFWSSLGNPTNMKSAMQHTLSVHKLIAGPGESIAPDRLQKWFRENNTMETIDPLKNLV